MSARITFSEKPSCASRECGENTSGKHMQSLGFLGFGEESDPLACCSSYSDDCRKDRKDFNETHSSVSDVHYYRMDNGFSGSSRNSQPSRPRKVHSPRDFRISLSYAKPSLQRKVPEEPTTAPALDGSA